MKHQKNKVSISLTFLLVFKDLRAVLLDGTSVTRLLCDPLSYEAPPRGLQLGSRRQVITETKA